MHKQENVLRLASPETEAWCVSQWPTAATANLCATTWVNPDNRSVHWGRDRKHFNNKYTVTPLLLLLTAFPFFRGRHSESPFSILPYSWCLPLWHQLSACPPLLRLYISSLADLFASYLVAPSLKYTVIPSLGKIKLNTRCVHLNSTTLGSFDRGGSQSWQLGCVW